jgi:hypothetical protein
MLIISSENKINLSWYEFNPETDTVYNDNTLLFDVVKTPQSPLVFLKNVNKLWNDGYSEIEYDICDGCIRLTMVHIHRED